MPTTEKWTVSLMINGWPFHDLWDVEADARECYNEIKTSKRNIQSVRLYWGQKLMEKKEA